jgi:hypothetical protein
LIAEHDGGLLFCGAGIILKKKALTVAITPRAKTILPTAATLALFCAVAPPAVAFELITEAEAALPPGKVPSFTVRSPTRLPAVTQLSPASGHGVVYSPLDFKLRFEAFGGAAIDKERVVITYVKQPDIDITQRIKPFITPTGIDIPQAVVPPGLHQFWVEVQDTDGRVGGREIDFQVVK